MFGASPTAAGVVVTPRTAMECSPVHCAVQLIAEAIGSLPLPVYSVASDGAKTPDTSHPVHTLLHDAANDWTAAGDFREQVTRDALLYPHGGFAHIVRVEDKPAELIRIDPERTPVSVTYGDDNEPIYKIGAQEIDRSNLLHIPSPSLNGRGLVYEGREEIGRAITLDRHASRLFGNSARPSGILTLKGVQTPDSIAKVGAAWKAAHGAGKSGSTAVIPSEASFQSVTLSSVDAQFEELCQLAITNVARLFRVPPHMLFQMGRATFNNSETMGTVFLVYTLLPWIRRWESEIALKLFTSEERHNYVAKFDTRQFLRPDFPQLIEALSKAVASRIYNPNEARAELDKAGYADGDKFLNPAIESTNANKVLEA
ncbi:phage portal protein [Bradyrhizobium sp. CCBAU 25338]|uniref:phage portal protein n=1 Tax=Bradyrhizobium sp. CCBAU 25338 TaxID=1641877 RepID=UPI0023029F6F|nr:phage portal protein [Bradyrhizobium sp. CCBAU 25338]